MKQCITCKHARYCCLPCQASHRAEHNPDCKKWAAERERDANRHAQQATLGSAAIGEAKSDDDCPICCEPLVNPISPCAEQLAHRFCRACIKLCEEKGISKKIVCPLCRGPVRSEEDFHYRSITKVAQAQKASTKEARKKLYTEAFQLIQEQLKIDPGSEIGQYNSGFMLMNGQGCKKDLQKAEVLYKKSAAQGFAMAQCNLGHLYGHGGEHTEPCAGDCDCEVVDKDPKAAFGWYEKAARQGNANAEHCLGVCFNMGDGVEKNTRAAAVWFEKAARQGHPLAQADIGGMYHDGTAVLQNALVAKGWYEAVLGNADASANPDRYMENLARLRALTNLGWLYFTGGKGVAPDMARAVQLYTQAADGGFAQAQANLGLHYLSTYSHSQGDRVRTNNNAQQAKHWLGLAADQGHVDATYVRYAVSN